MSQRHPLQGARARHHHAGPRLVFQQLASYRRDGAEGQEPLQPAEDLSPALQYPRRHWQVLRGHHQPGGARSQLQPYPGHSKGNSAVSIQPEEGFAISPLQEALKDCRYLMTLSLKGNPIRRVEQDTFHNLKVRPN